MNDTPGWASPGSAPSDGPQPDSSGAQPPEQPSDRGGADQPQQPSTWSQEQPPPGQWSAPRPQGPGQVPPPPGSNWGRPPAGPGGWGGPPPGPHGYGGWGWGPPLAAKPGVIPLRPLGVGEILDGAVSTLRTYWRTVLGIVLPVAVVTELFVILLQRFVLDNSSAADTLRDPHASPSELSHAAGVSLLSSGALLLVTLLGTIIATALLTTVTSRAVLGKPATTADAWRDARPQLARLLGLTLLLPLTAFAIVFAGALPGIVITLTGASTAGDALRDLGVLAGAIVSVWIMIRFSLASPALMLEKQGIRKSLSRSVKLVHGSWWRIFGIQLLTQLIALILVMIIMIPFTLLAGSLSQHGMSGLLTGDTSRLGWTFLLVTGVGSVISRMLTFPITAGVIVLLYIDQRIRREGLDLDLARAARVEAHGSHAPTPGS
ncbi:glycerophosphoryl diester phosphodiesterase membrane domain-containing protein [Streptomyces sp. RY43-2]|uniref:Glycerophosphoryl diester phosphodiesterase membrane domain-containing protein n=1 Tax=Streptomyces macrolidinus TaxID=2952607 RepID=A0ABT0ZMJ1_9ACTN|nr:glycerophosphoryl diester phosphodiesterase membrane domain-containing protein [Streptomyces macrolidinus]MCN9244755.1 glycerophosphoryl diester phosphodiesterase membrane domain-containing protein [Streptomyces macrolidinus]